MAGRILSDLLTQIHKHRKFTRDRAIEDIWRRNKLTPNSSGYRLAETTTLNTGGTEITEYRLYKLIDCSVVTLSAKMEADTQVGLDSIHERLR